VTRIHHKEVSPEAPLGAVIVTICEGSSYDRLFHEVPQQGDGGVRVASYSASGRSLQPLLESLRSRAHGAAPSCPRSSEWRDVRQLLEDIDAVAPASVVFNWECCSGCVLEDFTVAGEGPVKCREVVMDLMQMLLSRGHVVMVSDFSLKALIMQWCERRLGPNPFVKVGECTSSMELQFCPERLASCPSAQLQKVGEMCSEGVATLSAMAQTIVYTVDKVKADTPQYHLDVLTVVSRACGTDVGETLSHQFSCEVNGRRGTAGHVLLTYPSGGMLLASAGHWMELSHINVSEERLLQVATAAYGEAYSAQLSCQMAACETHEAREHFAQQSASRFIQQSLPSMYSK